MYAKILVPVVLDHEPNIASALEVAHALLDEGGEITLFHVMEDVPGYIVAQLPEGIMKQGLDELKARLNALANSAGSHVKAVVASGHPSRTILNRIGETDTDCVVIASHRPGLQDYLLGSTAARVVRHAACSVHVLR